MVESNEVLVRLLAAVAFGAAIGFERQWHQRNAGLQTNALVSLGSALFVTVNVLTTGDSSPTRVASMVVSGIGFLCAGVIMRQGLTITGLNTAATVWCAAGVGVLAGMGYVTQAGMGALTVILANLVLRTISRRLNARQLDQPGSDVLYSLKIECVASKAMEVRNRIVVEMSGSPLTLRSLNTQPGQNDRATVSADLLSVGRSDELMEQLVARLAVDSEVFGVRWEIPMQDESEPLIVGGKSRLT